MGGTALGASGRSNNGLKLDVKTGKLSLWRLFPTFTFTFTRETGKGQTQKLQCVLLATDQKLRKASRPAKKVSMEATTVAACRVGTQQQSGCALHAAG